jgi:hypothetical protein
MKRLLATRQRLFVLGVVASVAIVAASVYGYSAIAGPTPQSYTGCLLAGKLMNIVIDGTAPAPVCVKPAVQISWSQTGPTGPQGDTGVTGQTGATGATGPAGAATNSLFADVAQNGTLVEGSPGTTATHLSATGDYAVTFTRDVSSCAAAATIGINADGGLFESDGTIIANLGLGSFGNAVEVITSFNGGTGTDQSFHLIIVC